MFTLTVIRTHDYSGETHNFISRIEFDTFGRNLATFSSAQFGGFGISNDVVIEDLHTLSLNDIRVEMAAPGAFSAAGWTMENWNPDDDFIFLVGSNGGDSITGTSVNDRLLGGGGGDQLNGGAGGTDLASYAEATEGVTVWMLNPMFNLGEANGDTYLSIEDLEGSGFDDVLGANNAVNFVRGREGDDTLKGMGGADTLFGDEDNDILWGGADGDRLVGFTGDDTLIGGANADDLEGGTGTDTASYRDATEGFNRAGVAVFMLNTALNDGDADGDTYSSIENLEGSAFNDLLSGDNARNEIFGLDGIDILHGQGDNDTLRGGDNNDTLFGDTGQDALHGDDDDDILDGGTNSDTLSGGAGDDTLRGGSGSSADTLNGGDGVDEADYSDRTSTVVVTLAGASPVTVSIGGVAEDTVLRVEDVTGGSAGDTLRGDFAANTLRGLGGTDTLRGGGGADTLEGGNEADIFEYLAASDVSAGERIDGGSGSDTLRLGHSGNLSFQPATLVSIERIEFQGTATAAAAVSFAASQFGAGVSNAVQITGNGQQNAVNVVMTSAGTFSAASWTFVGWSQGPDILNLVGSTGNDNITGSSANDQISGGAGFDGINGGTGRDTVTYASNAGSVVVILGANGSAGQAIETDAQGNFASVDTLVNVEVALGSNVNDRLIGTAGDHELRGRGGSDDYVVLDAGVDVFENGSEGVDEVFAGVNYTLTESSDVEFLRTTDDVGTAPINLTGNGANNHLIGNNGVNLLEGGGGNSDILEGRGDDDTYIVRNANVEIREAGGTGNDTVAASVDYVLTEGADVELLQTDNASGIDDIDLTGNSSGNVVAGNDGNNVLNGGGGADTLIGNGEADRFLFNTALDAGNVDVIRDFEVGSDVIALDVDVFTALTRPKALEGPLTAEEFVVAAAAQEADDRIIYNNVTGDLLFDRDGVGGAAAFRFAVLTPGLSGLSAADFLVVL